MNDPQNPENNNQNKELEPIQAEEAAKEAANELTPEEKILALEQQVADLQDQFLRAKAEAENSRRRAIEEVAKAHKYAIEGFAEHLLPVVDSLTAALADQSDDLVKVREGVDLTMKQLMSALEKGRVIEINPVGQKFDPHQHQAISMVPSEQEANTVVAVLQKGYMIAERVLRPALVTVSQPK